MLKPALLVFAICILSFTGYCQIPAGYKGVASTASFQQLLAKNNAAIQSIQSDFSQTKVLKLLADKITSRGKFYFKKEDKVRIEYTSPYQYLLVMSGGQVAVRDEQKTSKINTRNSKTMQRVNRIIIDCMRGTVFANPDFKTTVYENGGTYLLSLAPANSAMQQMFQRIDVYMAKGSMDVSRLVMTEQGGDYTDMVFSHTQRNIVLNDALFKIK